MGPRSIGSLTLEVLRGVIGEPPVPMRSMALAVTVVAALLCLYAAAVVVLGGPAVGLLRLPAYIAVVVLAAAPAAISLALAYGLTFVLLPPGGDDLAGIGGPYDATFIVATAVVLRAIVVIAVSVRSRHLRREETLAARLDLALEIAERLAGMHDRAVLVRRIVDETATALDADAAVLRMVRDDRLEVAAWAGIDEATAAALPVLGSDEGWFGAIGRSGRAWVVEDARGVIDLRGNIVAPLVHHDRVIGALSAITFEPRRWTAEDVALLTALSTHAAIALRNAELFERTELKAAQVSVLQAASARLSRASGVEAVGRAIVEETRRIIDYHRARVFVLDDGDAVAIAAEGAIGADEQVELGLLRCRVGEGFTGWVAEHGRPLRADDAGADPRAATIPGSDDADESMLVVPMSYDGRVIGVISPRSSACASSTRTTSGCC